MTDPTKPTDVVLPLAPPEPPPAPATPVQQGMRVWYVLRGTTILGLLCIVIALVFFGVYLFSDKEHLHEVVILWAGIGFFGFGAHLVSRQSVKNFLADTGKYLPWGSKKSDTEEHPAEGGDG